MKKIHSVLADLEGAETIKPPTTQAPFIRVKDGRVCYKC